MKIDRHDYVRAPGVRGLCEVCGLAFWDAAHKEADTVMMCVCGHLQGLHFRVTGGWGACANKRCKCKEFTEAAPAPIEVEAAPEEPVCVGDRPRPATPVEDDLIAGLARDVGHRLLRAWEDLPSERRVMPMNRAFLSALALSMGRFLGALAQNEPEDLDGWHFLVAQTLEVVRQDALNARAWAVDGQAAAAVLIPEAKGVM